MRSSDRAAWLIAALDLQPHPEGGHYREIHRAASRVTPSDGRPARSALTVIYFLLAAGEMSRWHCVASDETWHFHEGDALELLVMDADFANVERRVLGAPADDAAPVAVVAAGQWQAARTTGAYTLVSCAVGPGFDFADFEMLRDRSDGAARIRERQPQFAALL